MVITDTNLLRQPCRNVSIFEAQDIITKLEIELSAPGIKGVGLAAIQIGILVNVCIIRSGLIKINLINPTIVAKYDLRMFKNEGCLSFPEQWFTTKRHNEIFVKDLIYPTGMVFVGLEAVIVQHEIGHLNGELMHDYAISLPLGPNSLCWCGGGKKWKKCHMGSEIKG